LFQIQDLCQVQDLHPFDQTNSFSSSHENQVVDTLSHFEPTSAPSVPYSPLKHDITPPEDVSGSSDQTIIASDLPLTSSNSTISHSATSIQHPSRRRGISDALKESKSRSTLSYSDGDSNCGESSFSPILATMTTLQVASRFLKQRFLGRFSSLFLSILSVLCVGSQFLLQHCRVWFHSSASIGTSLHRRVLTYWTSDFWLAFHYCALYLFPYYVELFSTWIPLWVIPSAAYAFLIRSIFTLCPPTWIAISRAVVPVILFMDFSHHSYLIETNGAERLVLAFAFCGLRSHEFLRPYFLLALGFFATVAVLFGHLFVVQWSIFLGSAFLLAEGQNMFEPLV
jgi:hypothetical protein